jgi:hypothetical protein
MQENKLKQYTLVAMAVLVVGVIVCAIAGGGGKSAIDNADVSSTDNGDNLGTEEVAMTETEEPIVEESSTAEPAAEEPTAEAAPTGDSPLVMLLTDDTIRSRNSFDSHLDSMPNGGQRLKINRLAGGLSRSLNDSNYLHIAVAEKIGIKPLTNLRAAWEAGAKLERLRSCQEYYLDNLTHSYPFLVPRAHKLLSDIGSAFRDSLNARGGGNYRIKVTSVLRTPRLVKRLRRRNGNAVDTSAHLYGTTFDISYAKFICDSPEKPRTQEDLKNLLGEVVYDMQQRGRCYVKFEHKQACFHITSR